VVRESVARLRRAVRFLLPEMEEGDGFVAAAPVMELREIFRCFFLGHSSTRVSLSTCLF
jgi:hypothetical protein